MNYIYILNYNTGECIIEKISKDIEDFDKYLSNFYNLDEISYMITDEIRVSIS